MKLFDTGKISEDVMQELVKACREGVYQCDGNEAEAIECIRENYCAFCFENLDENKELFSIWDISFETNRKCKIGDLEDEGLISDLLYEDCFDKLLAPKSGERDLDSKERNRIKKDYNEEHWKVRE